MPPAFNVKDPTLLQASGLMSLLYPIDPNKPVFIVVYDGHDGLRRTRMISQTHIGAEIETKQPNGNTDLMYIHQMTDMNGSPEDVGTASIALGCYFSWEMMLRDCTDAHRVQLYHSLVGYSVSETSQIQLIFTRE
jgi:hypothetical protein